MQKIFSVIEYMSAQKRKLSIQEIAVELGFSTATVYRILSGLRELGYVAQHANKQYYLTYKIYEVSGQIINRDGFIERLIPFMNYFVMKYGLEIGLTAFSDKSIIQIVNVGENITHGQLCPRPGQTFPAYCSAAGKVFLAQMKEPQLRRWIADSVLVPHTRNTIIDRDMLFAEIMKTKKQGYGVVVGELFDIIAAIAFPVHDRGGKVTCTFNFRMRTDEIEGLLASGFTDEVMKATKEFGL